MGNFLENVFEQLEKVSSRTVLREIHGEQFTEVTGRELLEWVGRARGFLRGLGLQPGERCALLGNNSIEWVTVDLALMAEGAIVVPLYTRQAPGELAGMMKDCSPRFLFVSDAELGESVAKVWPEAPPRLRLADTIKLGSNASVPGGPHPRKNQDLVTIIYTSGTSGEPKGVCLNTGNLNHIVSCTTGWMDRLDWRSKDPIQVFQYLPFNFAAS